MSGDRITRIQELRTQATHACMNALVGPTVQQIYSHESVKTALEVTDLSTDDEPGNMIVQESVWAEEGGRRYLYRVMVAVMVERERVIEPHEVVR